MKKFRIITKIGDRLVSGDKVNVSLEYGVIEILRGKEVCATFMSNEVIGVIEEI